MSSIQKEKLVLLRVLLLLASHYHESILSLVGMVLEEGFLEARFEDKS